MNNKTYTQEAVQELVILPEQELVIVEPATAYDADGYDCNGFNRDGYDRNGYNTTGRDKDGYCGLGYDKDGYNRDGYDCYGYNANRRDRYGYDRCGRNVDGYNRYGYDMYGYNREGYDPDGYASSGYNKDGYDRRGNTAGDYNEDGYDSRGYDSDGYNSDGYDYYGHDSDGYDSDGYNSDGYNSDGYDSDGYDSYGYNSNGYNEDGYDYDGYDSDGYNSDGYDSNGYNCDGYDEDGYNCDGYDEDGYDRYGDSYYDDDDDDDDDENYSRVADYKTLRRFDAIGDCTGYTLGFELEVVYKPLLISDALLVVESSKEAIAAISASDNEERVLAERDGSLPSTGVEFVTGYCNWDSHVEHLESLCKELDTRGFSAHRSAGVHIHVGNHGLLNEQTISGLVLCGINQPLIEAVAGRYTGDYVRAGFMPEDGPMNSSRYNAVNWRYDTVEFRVFSSTTCFTRLSMYAEFCRATVEYVNMLDALDTNIYIRTTEEFKASPLMYTEFVAWVSDNQARFPLLHDTIKELTGNNTGD